MNLETTTSKIIPTRLIETWVELAKSDHKLEVRQPVTENILALFGSLNAAEDCLKQRYETQETV